MTKHNGLAMRYGGGALMLCTLAFAPLAAGERRARPPRFGDDALPGVFYDDVTAVVSPNRPSAAELRQPRRSSTLDPAAAEARSSAGATLPAAAAGDGWESLVRPVSLEDEVKRLKLHFDGVVTAPGPFRSGGYQDARRDLSMLATLFAVIAQYDGDVRWKDQAAAARDLLARTAFNAKAGSVQVYNEAKLRKADLQDLVSGTGLSSRETPSADDWSMIVDRGPLMEYLDGTMETRLKPYTANPSELQQHADDVRRYGEMVAMVGRVLIQPGMDQADDADYQAFSRAMTEAAMQLREAMDRKDPDAARRAVGAIGQSCSACHEPFR